MNLINLIPAPKSSTMNIVQLLSLLIHETPPETSEDTREILRNYPGCGQLGNPSNKECFWDCEWGPNPFLEISQQQVFFLLYDNLIQLGMCQDI